jgi:hypothetical protein
MELNINLMWKKIYGIIEMLARGIGGSNLGPFLKKTEEISKHLEQSLLSWKCS